MVGAETALGIMRQESSGVGKAVLHTQSRCCRRAPRMCHPWCLGPVEFGHSQGHSTFSPACSHTHQLWMGCSSLPAWLLGLFCICLTILTEAQHKDQLSKQQKWCCKLFPCPGMPCESTGVPWEGWIPCTRSAMGFWLWGFLKTLSDTLFCHRWHRKNYI